MTVMIMTSQNTSNVIKCKKPYKSWTKDGVNGGPSSIQVLIKWLSQKPNYKRWKRGDYLVDRIPKKELLEEIIDQLRQAGIYHRLTKDVASKISTLQSNYRVVKQWNDTEGNKLRFAGVNNKAVHGKLIIIIAKCMIYTKLKCE
jgi:hypothetical protein